MTQPTPRRAFLKTTAAASAGLLLNSALSPTIARADKSKDAPQPFDSYTDLLATVKATKKPMRILGYAPDRSPIVAIRAGGDKLPAILISAGSHATEHAGVRAAVELIEQLDTDHQVYVLPTRDPIGLNGFRYALSLALGEQPKIDSLEEAEALLRKRGEILYDADGRLLTLIGEIGYANRGLYRRIKKGTPLLEPLKGRRIYFPSRYEDVPGSGPLQRAYTLVVTPEGEILHMNRFHDTSWAPAEVRCLRSLMAEIKPGLVFDLHEHGSDAFWFSARKQRTEEDEIWEQRMAREAIRAVAASGVKLAPESYNPGGFFIKQQQGVFTLDPSKRGEGLNLIDFAASKYGPGFTVETGMKRPFAYRVAASMLTVQTAVKVFEARY